MLIHKRSTLACEIATLSKYNYIVALSVCLMLHYRFRHKNLVELMGFCSQPACIVYEYLEIGSLFDCLHIIEVKTIFTIHSICIIINLRLHLTGSNEARY